MILIDKGAVPAVLAGDGKTFQDQAIKYALTGDCDDADMLDDFEKYEKTIAGRRLKAPNGANFKLGFAGFKSELFSVYSHYSHHTVKNQIVQEQFGKCGYCEALLRHLETGDVDHVAPKAEVTELDLDSASRSTKANHTGFFWLSQTWGNLVLACKECNETYKRARYDLFMEAGVLINPADPSLNPRDVLWFDPDTAIVNAKPGGSGDQNHNGGRAFRTIDILGLNRPRLVQKRAAHLVKLRALFVLAADRGALPVTESAPDIMKLTYPEECAGSDAQRELAFAVSKYAEFSACAQDAITAWNKELQFAPAAVPLSQLSPMQVRVVTARLRLKSQVDLEIQTAQANLNEAPATDTSEADSEYNECLDRYKTLVEDCKRWLQATQKVRDKANQLDREIADYYEKLQHAKALKYRVGRLFAATKSWNKEALTAQEQSLVTEWNGLSPEERTLEYSEVQPLAGKLPEMAAYLGKRKEELKELRKTIPRSLDGILAELLKLEIDIGLILGWYQNHDSDVQSRCVRAMDLATAVKTLGAYMEGNPTTLPGAPLKDHFNNKKWPPKIRGA